MTGCLRHAEPVSGVAVLLLDRPAVRNAIDLALVGELRVRLAELAARNTIRAIVLASATPGMFCAGADLSVSDTERRLVSDELYALYQQMITLGTPVIAAVDGAAVGGGAQLALAADIRLGSSSARFRFAGPGHGLAVGPWALPSTVGRRALELVLSQRFVTADEAVAIGLLDRLAADPLAEATALAGAVRSLDPAAVRRAKEHVVGGERLAERLVEERSGNAAVFTGSVGIPRT
ncbi:MAG: enoyl-CoA hydratase/isomerase family protein [Sciscionella sp.]